MKVLCFTNTPKDTMSLDAVVLVVAHMFCTLTCSFDHFPRDPVTHANPPKRTAKKSSR